jgi:hypothetical protein
MHQFNTEGEFLAALGDRWRGNADGPELLAALSAGVGRAEAEVRQDGDGEEAGLDLRLKGWVLRNEDLPVAEAIGVVAAVVTAATGPVGLTAAAAVAAVSGFATMCWKAWRRGAPLSRNEIALLGFLEVHGPMTEEALVSKVTAQFPDMTAEDVRSDLQSLGDVNLRDGSVAELVRRDASGRWRTTATT